MEAAYGLAITVTMLQRLNSVSHLTWPLSESACWAAIPFILLSLRYRGVLLLKPTKFFHGGYLPFLWLPQSLLSCLSGAAVPLLRGRRAFTLPS